MSNLKMEAALIYRLLRLKITGRKEPVFVCFYLTNRCNLRCKYCFVMDEKIDKKILSAEFTRDEAFHFVDEFYSLGTRMMFLLGGEPLMHKHIGDIVEYIVRKGIVLHVVTNGTLLGEKYEAVKKAHDVCVSLDGVGEMNDCLRGEGVYERAMAGLKKAREHGVRLPHPLRHFPQQSSEIRGNGETGRGTRSASHRFPADPHRQDRFRTAEHHRR